MRRKSERAPSKKAKVSPEKKIEKVKRTRTRRKKNSTSSENESTEDVVLVQEVEPVVEADTKMPETLPKEENPEDAQDQVWQVKAPQGASDVGEIQKLKICLTRPPSTPERAERSPRSKRKHSRATSSSDTTSVEAVDEKKKSKHRSKRAPRNSKDDSEKNDDSHGDEQETESGVQDDGEKQDNEVTQSGTDQVPETTVSTTDEEKVNEAVPTDDSSANIADEHKSDADTTVVSPKVETTAESPREKSVPKDAENDGDPQPEVETLEKESPVCERRESLDKSEVLELHPEESKIECSEIEIDKIQVDDDSKETVAQDTDTKVSITSDKTAHNEAISNTNEGDKATNECGVLDSENVEKETRKMSTDSEENKSGKSTELRRQSIENEHSAPSQPVVHEDAATNGQAAPIVVVRKRRWGARPKLTSQKSITISTDVLKDIIPDVKPVEFDEVIEEKKHKRVEVSEKIERPVLPKIIIDNTENVDLHRKEHIKEEKEKDVVKARDYHLSSNRKISIIKDNDSIIARPPSPPRHKQSRILYITNLVRPFTLQQLKNLLQRTGKIAENGFWIDKIKSKCYVRYEEEDQAVETRHALHGVTWPVSNPKTLQVDFSTEEAFDKAKLNEDSDNAKASTIPGTVEDWLREQDMKREQGEVEKPWERKTMREWDLGKNEKDKEKEKLRREERPIDKRRHRSPEKSPEPARKFKKKEEEAPAKLLDDLFKKTKTTPCIYWLPLSAETIAVKEEQRRQHMVEYERRLLEHRRPHRRH